MLLYIFIILYVWLTLELLFYFYLKYKLQSVSHINYITTPDYYMIFRVLYIVNQLKSCSIKKFFRGFFLGAKFKDIKREDVISFLSWCILNKKTTQLTSEEYRNINNIVDEIEIQYDISFPQKSYSRPGNCIKHIAMSLEAIKYKYQPLILYVTYYVLHRVCNFILKCMGFKRYYISTNHSTYSYLYKKGVKQTPTIFFHGISSGWYTYLHFIMNFHSSESVILFELEPFRIGSLDLSRPSSDDVVDAIKKIVNHHEFKTIDIVGHSFGTCVCSWIIKKNPDIIRRVILVDPVNLLLCMPDVAYNFLYKKPTAFFHRIIRYFASEELTIAHSMYRNFLWMKNILFLEDMPKNIDLFVSLSYGDEIIPTKQIVEYLEINNAKFIVWDRFSHAQSISTSNLAISKIHKNMKN